MTVSAGITAMIALTVASAAAFGTLLGLCLRRDPPGVLPHGARARRAAAASQEGSQPSAPTPGRWCRPGGKQIGSYQSHL